MNNKLKALKDEILSVMPDNLVSMIVFGSVSRGDALPDSDVDLIVVVKEKTKRVIKLMRSLEASLMDASINWAEKKMSGFLNEIGFKKNIFLFSMSEWRKKKFAPFCSNHFLSKLILPKGIIWSGVKRDGMIIAGSDLLRNLKPRITLWDRIKAPLPGIFACLFALFLFTFHHDRAIALAQTGVKWAYMNVCGVVQRSNIESLWGNLIQVFKISFSRH